MACTRQSAVEYVRNARVHLVRALNNLNVIVENLYQQRVLTGEEVSKIKTERDDYDKRKLVDSLINKGNKACYEFLKILHVMRKSTSGRSPHLQRRNETSEFDQYDWASCFFLEEDTQKDAQYLQGLKPCYTYQKKLKSQAQDKSNEFWKKSQNLFQGNKKPDLSYTPLVLEHGQESDSPSKIKKLKRKKSKMPRRKKLKTYIPEEKSDLSLSDLLKMDKNILLVGKPGIGKTALVHELLRLWAERASSELDYIFYFDMRDTSQIMAAKSWEDLCGFCERDEDIKEVIQDIQRYSDNVTFIFDGATDLSSLPVVEKLIKKQMLPFAKVIITCRPEDEDEEFFPEDFDRVEVKGFSEHTIKTYLSATLGEEQKILGNLELFSFCHVPMYAFMVAVCFFSQESPQPCTVTETYINVVRYCLQINSGTKLKDLNTLIFNKSKDILSLAEVSYKATQKKTVNLDKVKCEDRCVLSFLKLLFIEVAPTEVTAECTFLHYTVQEFFAAVWLLKNPDEIREVFQQCLTVEKKHLKHLIPFMCRLVNEKQPSLMEHLIPVTDLKNISRWFFKELIDTFLCQKDVSDCEDSGPSLDLLFLCQCLYESQHPEACIYLLNKLNYNLDLSGEDLDLFPTCAVAYVVKQSKERKIFLNLEDANISEHGMRQLFGCLINVQWCDPLPRQLWKIFLLSKGEINFAILLDLGENQMHLPVEGERRLFERAVEVIEKMTRNVGVCLYWDRQTSDCRTLCFSLLEALPSISSLRA
ncbi:protein NLRC5-like [Pholidichthys leucotaenia]